MSINYQHQHEESPSAPLDDRLLEIDGIAERLKAAARGVNTEEIRAAYWVIFTEGAHAGGPEYHIDMDGLTSPAWSVASAASLLLEGMNALEEAGEGWEGTPLMRHLLEDLLTSIAEQVADARAEGEGR